MTFFESFAAGGLAGFLCIVASYPQVHMQSVDKDLIKTKVQCEVITPPFERIYSPTYCDGGTIKCARSIFKSGGYKGCTRCIDVLRLLDGLQQLLRLLHGDLFCLVCHLRNNEGIFIKLSLPKYPLRYTRIYIKIMSNK